MDTSKRLLSIDALRGFDMLFIMGFSALIVSICALFPGGDQSWLARQMAHVDWNGLAHHDTIFPLFLFISGMTFPFSYAKRTAAGSPRGKIYWEVIRRGLVLCLLGLVYNGFFKLELSTLRLPSVLARIGLAWMFAALIYMNVKKVSWRIVIAGVLLLGYWALFALVAPDAPGASPYSQEGAFVGYVDRQLIPDHLLSRGKFDPEGILSTLPAIVTAMLGMFLGEFVRIPEEKISGKKKTLWMVVAAVGLLAAGLLWSTVFPINKKLWTSTFVLVVGAYSVAMYALFYWLIDVKGWKKWTFFFRVIGMNSITIYMAMRIISFSGINRFFLGGLAGLVPEPVGAVILNAGYVAVCWLFLYFLYKKNVFLKV